MRILIPILLLTSHTNTYSNTKKNAHAKTIILNKNSII